MLYQLICDRVKLYTNNNSRLLNKLTRFLVVMERGQFNTFLQACLATKVKNVYTSGGVTPPRGKYSRVNTFLGLWRSVVKKLYTTHHDHFVTEQELLDSIYERNDLLSSFFGEVGQFFQMKNKNKLSQFKNNIPLISYPNGGSNTDLDVIICLIVKGEEDSEFYVTSLSSFANNTSLEELAGVSDVSAVGDTLFMNSIIREMRSEFDRDISYVLESVIKTDQLVIFCKVKSGEGRTDMVLDYLSQLANFHNTFTSTTPTTEPLVMEIDTGIEQPTSVSVSTDVEVNEGVERVFANEESGPGEAGPSQPIIITRHSEALTIKEISDTYFLRVLSLCTPGIVLLGTDASKKRAKEAIENDRSTFKLWEKRWTNAFTDILDEIQEEKYSFSSTKAESITHLDDVIELDAYLDQTYPTKSNQEIIDYLDVRFKALSNSSYFSNYTQDQLRMFGMGGEIPDLSFIMFKFPKKLYVNQNDIAKSESVQSLPVEEEGEIKISHYIR